MIDKENVINHLQIIHTWAEFARERDLQFFTAKHLEDIAQWADDALNLLKEQEAKNVVNMTLSKNYSLIASCPKCNVLLTRVEHKNYCGYCGQAVKWE